MNVQAIQNRIAPQEPDHVTVALERWGRRPPTAREARDVVESIQRHVDGIGDVSVELVRRCRHCGRDPEFDEDDGGEPCCCQEAIVEWKVLRSAEGI